MMNWDNFKRDEFTLEDQEIISRVVDGGHVNNICQEIAIDSPVKEYWVNKIVKAYSAPIVADLKDFSAEMREVQAKGGEITPEIEAQYEAKLQAERQAALKEAEMKQLAEEESLQRTVEIHVEKESKRKSKKVKETNA
jgi:hypothetical protein